MKLRHFFPILFVALLARGGIAAEQPSPQSIILASTTSVENSGLLAHILPAFTKETGITVHVLAQGTRRHFRRRFATMPIWFSVVAVFALAAGWPRFGRVWSDRPLHPELTPARHALRQAIARCD